MVKMNIVVLLCATLVPLIVGFVWYNPSFGFGKAWMRSAGVTPESAKGANMAVVFGLTIVFSFFMAVMLQFIVIHQVTIGGFLHEQKDYSATSESHTLLTRIMELYGDTYRTFKHGMLHGFFAGSMIALPVLTVNALFERRGFRYIAINAGYWIVSMMLMGGVICQFT